MSDDDWKKVCSLDEIPCLGARRVERAKGPQVAVFRTADDEVHALLDRCPHRAGPLSQGIVFGRAVACPLHNWTIELATGCAREPDEGATPRFAVRLEGGAVFLRKSELDKLGTDFEPVRAGPCAHAC
ncbi:MAG: nitrite reductase small subunit NirD [Paucibacter sp.]|nr:nitrite reductase small subunit NirD [Roseateles sp.]